MKGSLIKLAKKNNTLIELTLCKVLRKISKPIKTKIEKLIKEVLKNHFLPSLETIFSFFQQLFENLNNQPNQ